MKNIELPVLIAMSMTLCAFLTGTTVGKLLEGHGDVFTEFTAASGMVTMMLGLSFVIRALRKAPHA